MKNFARLSFTAVLFAFIFSISANAQNILPEILKRMDDHNKALTSLKSNLRMSKYNPQLKIDEMSEGTVAYRPNGKDIAVRIDWTKPRAETLAVYKGQYVAYTPSLNQAYTGKTDGKSNKGALAKNGLSFINMSKSQLKTNYSVVYAGKESVEGVECWKLSLTPKAKANYKQAELWVDGNGMPRQSKIIENSGDITTIVLSGLVKNEVIDGSIFAVNLPPGTKIVKG
jgi:outer membrane lipoprotein-sorting protein